MSTGAMRPAWPFGSRADFYVTRFEDLLGLVTPPILVSRPPSATLARGGDRRSPQPLLTEAAG